MLWAFVGLLAFGSAFGQNRVEELIKSQSLIGGDKAPAPPATGAGIALASSGLGQPGQLGSAGLAGQAGQFPGRQQLPPGFYQNFLRNYYKNKGAAGQALPKNFGAAQLGRAQFGGAQLGASQFARPQFPASASGAAALPAGASQFPAGGAQFPAGAAQFPAGGAQFPAGAGKFPAGGAELGSLSALGAPSQPSLSGSQFGGASAGFGGFDQFSGAGGFPGAFPAAPERQGFFARRAGGFGGGLFGGAENGGGFGSRLRDRFSTGRLADRYIGRLGGGDRGGFFARRIGSGDGIFSLRRRGGV